MKVEGLAAPIVSTRNSECGRNSRIWFGFRSFELATSKPEGALSHSDSWAGLDGVNSDLVRLSAQHGQLMLKSENLEYERGAAAKTENEDRCNSKENRHHNRHGTENH